MSSCFFIGHRNTPEAIYDPLLESIKRHIREHGVLAFYVGHCGAFDCMASRALCEAKSSYPHIKNYLLLVYHPAIKKVDTPKGFESTLFLEGQEKSPPRYAIANFNKRMVQKVDYLITYSRYITDGSHNLLNYAMAKEKKGLLVITNLATTLPGI